MKYNFLLNKIFIKPYIISPKSSKIRISNYIKRSFSFKNLFKFLNFYKQHLLLMLEKI